MKELVWFHSLKEHNDIKSKLLDIIENTDKQFEWNHIDSITNTDFYNENHHTDRPYVSVFINSLTEFFEVFRKNYCAFDFEVTNCWFQQYYKNDIHSWHLHGETNISLVYFIELNKKDRSTEFYDTKEKQTFQLDVKEGDIVVFPSFIPHRSPKIITDDRKTIISCNINLIHLDVELMDIDVNI